MYHDKDRDECKKHSSLSDHLLLFLRQYRIIKAAALILQFGLDFFGRKQDAGLAGGVGQTALHIADHTVRASARRQKARWMRPAQMRRLHDDGIVIARALPRVRA